MTVADANSAIIAELLDIEVILRHLSRPESLSAPDGEHVCAILAQAGLGKIDRIQHILSDLAKE